MRSIRLADQIRDTIAINLTTVLRDPRLKDVTVTHVNLSADLQIATIYFRTLRDDHHPTLVALKGACGFLRRKLARVLDVKRVPELRFFYDTSIEHAAHIEELLAKIR